MEELAFRLSLNELGMKLGSVVIRLAVQKYRLQI